MKSDSFRVPAHLISLIASSLNDGKKNDRQRGATDQFTISSPEDLGSLKAAVLEMQDRNGGGLDDWSVTKISINDLKRGRPYEKALGNDSWIGDSSQATNREIKMIQF